MTNSFSDIVARIIEELEDAKVGGLAMERVEIDLSLLRGIYEGRKLRSNKIIDDSLNELAVTLEKLTDTLVELEQEKKKVRAMCILMAAIEDFEPHPPGSISAEKIQEQVDGWEESLDGYVKGDCHNAVCCSLMLIEDSYPSEG